MNGLVNLNNHGQLMSSREIAELTGKEHKNVLRVNRDLKGDQILDAQIEPLKFEYRGQWFDYYELNKRDSLVVVARLSPEFTAAVIDRWQELEQGQQFVPKTYPEALRLAATLAEEVEQSRQQLALAAPKVDYYDKVVERETLIIASQISQ